MNSAGRRWKKKLTQLGLPVLGMTSLALLSPDPLAWGASESPQTFSFMGRFLNEAGTAPLTSVVNLTLGIYNSAGTCLLYEETHTGVDLSLTEGMFSVDVGSAVGSTQRTSSDPAFRMSQVFANTGTQLRAPASANCAAGYTPGAGDTRILRVTVTPQGGTPFTMSPDPIIDSAPQAMVAETLQGIGPSGFLQPNAGSNLSQTTLQQLTGATDASTLHNHDSLYAKLSASSSISLSSGSYLGLGTRATDPSGLGAGDVGKTWYDSSANVIKYWDGSAVKTLGVSGSGLVVSAGSAAAPSLGVGTSSNGLFYPTTNQLGIVTNGTEKLRIDNNGNVGIGTTAPTSPLTVSGTNLTVASLISGGSLRVTGQDSNGYQLTLGGNGTIKTDGSGSLQTGGNLSFAYASGSATTFTVSGVGEKLRLDSSGNVGIGTNSPNSPLQVNGAISTALNAKSSNYTLTANDSVVIANASGGALTLTLPTAVGTSGRQYTIKKIDSSANTVGITTTSSQTIDGGSITSLTAQYQWVSVISDGANWSIVGTGTVVASGATPNVFSFTNQTDQGLGALVQSNVVTVTGFTGTLTANVSGGGSPLISINGGAWTPSGAIQSGQTLQVLMTTSGSVNTSLTATVTVGTRTANWQVTTIAGSLKIFETPSGYAGSAIGGISGANAICQAAAGAAGYSGSYLAVISDDVTNAKDRLTLSYPIVNAYDGTTVASTNLWVGSLTTAIKNPSGGSSYVWTGTNVDGTKALGNTTCRSWTGGTNGLLGYPGSTDTNWTVYSPYACSGAYSVICIQQTAPFFFSFTNLEGQARSTLVSSNTITVSPFSGTLTASVSGGGSPQISINGGAWTTSGSIQSGQTLQVQLTTSASWNTPLTATLTIGTASSSWKVTTQTGALKIFQTSAVYLGSALGGLAGADSYCQTAASNAGYTGTYKAVLSDETTNAKDRFTLSYPIVNAYDGTTVASTNLWAGSLTTGIKNPSGGSSYIWTGTNVDGTKAAGNTCSSWTGGTNGLLGYPGSTDTNWTVYSPYACSGAYTLFCIQQ